MAWWGWKRKGNHAHGGDKKEPMSSKKEIPSNFFSKENKRNKIFKEKINK